MYIYIHFFQMISPTFLLSVKLILNKGKQFNCTDGSQGNQCLIMLMRKQLVSLWAAIVL